MRIKLLHFLAFTISLVACEDNNRNFQIIFTGEVTEIDKSGATLKAKIVSSTEAAISQYGFIWGLNRELSSDDSKVTFSGPLKEGVFSYRIKGDLYQDSIYYMRPFFVCKEGLLVQGSLVTFSSLGSSPPIINDFNPKLAFAGDTIYISGNNFSLSNVNNQIFVNNKKLKTTYSSEKLIKVLIPNELSLVSIKSILTLNVSSSIAQSRDTLTIKETWIKMCDFHLYQNGGMNIHGFYINDILYLGYDIYNGLFGLNLNTQTVISIPNPYVPTIVFSINDKGYLLFPTMEYNTITHQWVGKAAFPGSLRNYGVSFVIGDNAYVGLGSRQSDNLLLKDFWKYDSKLNSWSRIADFPGTGRIRATSFTYNNKGYVGIGGSGFAPRYKDIWEYDPDKNVWTSFSDFPGTLGYYVSATTFNNKVYIGPKDFWEYDFIQMKWKCIGYFPEPYSCKFFIHNNMIYRTSYATDNYFSLWKFNKYE